MQRMLLEQQNKRRLMMQRQEQDSDILVPEPGGMVGEPNSADSQQISLKRRLSDSDSEIELDDQVLGLDLNQLQNYIGRLAKRATSLKTMPVAKSRPTHRHLTLYRIQSYSRMSETRRNHPDVWDPYHSDPFIDAPEAWRNRPDSRETVLSAPFIDAPEWIGPADTGTLHCKVPIHNFDLFLEKNKDISFIVFKTYAIQRPQPYRIVSETDDVPEITVKESIKPITKELVEGVKLVLGSQDKYVDLRHDFKATSELAAPYLFIFHQRGYPDTLSDSAKQTSREQLTSLWNHVIQKHGDEYTTADASLSTGKVTPDTLKYLFKPGDVVIQRKGDLYSGWVARSWAKHIKTYQTIREKARVVINRTSRIPLYGTETASKEMANERVWVQSWTIPAWNWDFDGNFQRKHQELSFFIVTENDPGPGPGTVYASKARTEDASSTSEDIPISGLEVFPIQYAPQEVVQQLRRRGKAFWKCRNRKLVSYEDRANDSQDNMVSNTSRVMVAR